MDEKIILGIDPGTTLMGYGLIKVVNNKMVFLLLNELNLSKYSDHYLKLKHIFDRTIELIDNYKPDEISIEAPFFGKNVQSMLKLGRAQGVAMAAGLQKDVPIFEYAPKKIKKSITGNGNASKEQLAKFRMNFLKFKHESKNKFDATDALGAALCHHFQTNLKSKESSSWKKFVSKNKTRIIN